MRILLLQDYLRNGGTEQQTLAIAGGLAAANVETHVVVFRRGGTLDSQAENQAYQLHYLKQGPLKTDWFAPSLRKFLAQIKPDVLIPMGRMANCHAGLLPRKRPYKLVASLRTGKTIPYLYRRALRRADRLVANSQNALSRLKSQYGIHTPDTSNVIYNGCIRDFQKATPNSNTTTHLCSVSMFRTQKRQIRLIRICSKLPSDIDWKLTLAGTGPTRKACQAETIRLGLTERITFPGFLADPRDLYQSADIALHVSKQESLPNFLIEAQMAGLPVIAYDVNGVSETFIHEQSGYLVPYQNESQFLDKLISLIRNPDRKRAFSKAALNHAQFNFSLQKQTAAYKALLKSLNP